MKNVKNILVFTILFYIVIGSFTATFSYVQSAPKKTASVTPAPSAATEEASEEPVQEPAEEAAAVPATETVEEAAAEKPEVSVEEPVTPIEEPEIPVVEPTPTIDEPLEQAEPAEEIAEEIHYYAFKTNHTQNRLNVRETPSVFGKIVGQLKLNSSGYILEKGDSWCKIESGTLVGYSFSEYLDIYEITKEEFENR